MSLILKYNLVNRLAIPLNGMRESGHILNHLNEYDEWATSIPYWVND